MADRVVRPVPSFKYSLDDKQIELNWMDLGTILKRLGYGMKVLKRRPGGAIKEIMVFPSDHNTSDGAAKTVK